MATNQQKEGVWTGRVHLGDEPGIYGNASYNGLSAELPLTVYRSDAASREEFRLALTLFTESVETYAGYEGHRVVVTLYEADPSQPYHSVERIVAEARLTSADANEKTLEVSVPPVPGPFWLSVKLRCDTTVNPGLYDDFLLTGLSFSSANYALYASFGFHNA